MPDPVEIAFHRAAQRLLTAHSVILAGVSGGGDSVALLHLLQRYARKRGIRVVVAHLDHALRRGSAADRRFVEALARKLELECLAEQRAVRRLRRKDESPEEAARRVRRSFLLDSMRRAGATAVATGHTLDDQAETILLRLARGAGSAAIAGMSEEGPGPFVRPLLALERIELRRYLRRKRIAYIEDPSNDDPRFPRNRVRREIVPLLAAAVNPRAVEHIVAAAGRLRADAEFLDRLADEQFARLARGRTGTVALPVRALLARDPVLRGRIVRLALRRAGVDPRRISARHVAAVLALASRAGAGGADLPGVRAVRAKDELVIRERSIETDS